MGNSRSIPAEFLHSANGSLTKSEPADAEPLRLAVQESWPLLAPWFSFAIVAYDRHDALQFIERATLQWQQHHAFQYAIRNKQGTLAGTASLHARDQTTMSIGYWLSTPHLGKGHATTAAAALTHEAIRCGIRTVCIEHDEANLRSGLVPQRLGFTRTSRREYERTIFGDRTGVELVWQYESCTRTATT